MGAVYAGTHTATEMRVAVKVLRPALLSSPAAERQFELEAKVAARVQSEHIVKVFDAGKDAETGLPYLVMELLDGCSLEQLVEQAGALPPQTVVSYLEQVAMGLDRAHGYVDSEGKPQPIVHRDLKPENIFVTKPDTLSPRVKILDFGIAKVLSDTAAVSQELRGTPLYMSYEQVCGQAVSPQTDVWALGLIAFYALTGRTYWKTPSLADGTIASLLAEITTQPTPPASERGRELRVEQPLPAAFDVWLARCLEREPQRRFTSSTRAIAELSLALSVLPFAQTVGSQSDPPLRESGFPSTLKSPAPPHSPMGSTTGQLAISSSDLAMRPRGSGTGWALLLGGALVLVLFGAVAYVAFRSDETSLPAPASAGPTDADPAPQVSDEPEGSSAHTPDPAAVDSVAVDPAAVDSAGAPALSPPVGAPSAVPAETNPNKPPIKTKPPRPAMPKPIPKPPTAKDPAPWQEARDPYQER